MADIRLQLANELCSGNASLNPEAWLADELSDLALKIAGLDELPTTAVFPLARLSALGPSDQHALAAATGLDLETILECLEALEERKFVTLKDAGYEATDRGKEAIEELGRKMVIRKRFEMKRHYDHYDRIYQQLSQL